MDPESVKMGQEYLWMGERVRVDGKPAGTTMISGPTSGSYPPPLYDPVCKVTVLETGKKDKVLASLLQPLPVG